MDAQPDTTTDKASSAAVESSPQDDTDSPDVDFRCVNVEWRCDDSPSERADNDSSASPIDAKMDDAAAGSDSTPAAAAMESDGAERISGATTSIGGSDVAPSDERSLQSPPSSADNRCELCKESFADARECRRHVKSVHGGIVFACVECGRAFSKQESFRIHCGIAHPSGKLETIDVVKSKCRIVSSAETSWIGSRLYLKGMTGKEFVFFTRKLSC